VEHDPDDPATEPTEPTESTASTESTESGEVAGAPAVVAPAEPAASEIEPGGTEPSTTEPEPIVPQADATAAEPDGTAAADPVAADPAPTDATAAVPEPEPAPADADETTSSDHPAPAGERPIPPPPGYGSTPTGATGAPSGRRPPKRPRSAPPPAHIVDVEVSRVDGAEVEVRLADGRTGVIDRRDFPSTPSVGETVAAAVLSRDDDRRGRVALSHRWARTELAWQRVEKARAEHTPLTGRVVKEVKGGVVVDLGLRAFLPTSLIGEIEITEDAPSAGPSPAEPAPAETAPAETAPAETAPAETAPAEPAAEAEPAEPSEPADPTGEPTSTDEDGSDTAAATVTVRVADPSALVGREVEVLVTEADRAKDRLVVSRRDLQRRRRRKDEKERWTALKVGSRVTGRVVSVADYGAVVDLGGLRGLVHRSELSWQRFGEPADVVTVGDQVTVEVLDVNRSKKRVSLSLRRTSPDPYAGIEVGQIVPATITRVVEYGAFARLESGAEGLIHMSELSDVPGYRPDQLVVPGEDVMVKVLNVDRSKHRIGLSVRRVLVDD
jgi:predicted RNA-binding protein with RPS1 domain